MSEISLQPLVETTLSVVLEPNSIDLSYKVNDHHTNNFSLSQERSESDSIQCYMNPTNALSFINNSNVFQTVEDDCGEIYYACLGPNNNNIVNHPEQVLQLIPQNQISNYIISDKEYANVNFVNSSVINENNYYDIHNSTYDSSKFHYENLVTNSHKSICNNGKQICEVCSLEFPSKRTYLKHMSIHENDREFKCSWCKLSYNHEVNLLVHIAIIHSNECTVVDEVSQEINYKCAICSCIFSRKKAHQAHCLIHQVDEELQCEHCTSLFKCKILLDRHLNDHKIGDECSESKMPTNYLKCKICHEIFENVGNVKKHYIRCHPKNKLQWNEEMESAKLEETIVLDEEKSGKRKSSKIACQTIKLYAQGRTQNNEIKQDSNKSLNKRGRPKKSEGKSLKSNSSCMVCNKSFKTPILLRRHEVTHTGVKEFECPICKKGFTQKSSVKIHMVVHDNVKGFSCQFCSKTFTYEHNMNTHIKVIHKNNDMLSKSQEAIVVNESNELPKNAVNAESQDARLRKIDCVSEVVNPSTNDDAEISQYLWNDNPLDHSLVDNMSYQPNQTVSDSYMPSAVNFSKVDWDKSHQGILLSEDIERIDKETGQVQIHEVIKDQVTGFKRFRCRFCCKLFRKSCDLTRHVRLHTQLKPFQCYMCHKSFRLKSILKNHFKSHWKLKEYSCEICKKSFNLKQTLKVHQQLHNPNTLKYCCKSCDKQFNTSFHLKYHTNTNHRVVIQDLEEIAKIETEKAIKPLIWNELLNQPVPIPDVERKKLNNRLFKCNHCGKSYKFKKYLNEHLKDHLSANKTNICHFCNKSFVTYRSMQQHLRTQHLNRRKFSCLQCPAFFITKASLIRHGLVHSNSKPFACPLCLRRFKAKIYCDRHISAKKCSKRKSNFNKSEVSKIGESNLLIGSINSLVNPLETEIMTNGQTETFANFRLEDLDLNTSHSSNILVTNYVNEFSSFPSTEKYMIVSLDNPTGKDHINNQNVNSCNQNTYYTSNILLDDSSLLEIARSQIDNSTDSSENIMGLLEGQIGVTPIDIGSLFAVQSFNGNLTSIPGQLVDGTIQSSDIDYPQQDNIYYYQTINEISSECQEPPKGSLADKFPILKASLFSDEELNNSKVTSSVPVYSNNNNAQFILPSDNNQLNVSTATGIIEKIHDMKFYHGCANCDQQFKNSATLVQHVKNSHKIQRDFVCNVCHKAFSAKLSLWAHSKTHIDSRSFGCFVCIACNQRFISVPSLSRHVRMQHNDNLNLYRCTHCNKVYKTTRELDSHIKQLVSDYDALIIDSNIIENSNSNELLITGQFTKSNTDRANEVDIDKVYFTSLNSSQIDHIATLDVSSASKLSLKELIKAAKETKELSKLTDFNKSTIDSLLSYPYSCSICHKGFNRASNLQQHLSVHTKLKPYQCTKCPKRFRHRCSLKTHEATKHCSVTKLLRCHLCLKLLRSQIALRNHMKLHMRNYEFHCNICFKGFDTLEEHSKHAELKHSQNKGTSKFTETINSEVKEIASEIPKKLFKCLSCSFIFNTRSKYDNHFCVGLNTEKSQLNRCCDKTFESTSQLLYHMQEVHNQIIQYNCAQCNIMFAQESSFINHQKSVHHL